MSAPAGRVFAGRAAGASGGPDPREAAFTVLYRVESGRAFANVLLHRVLERGGYAPADQALVTELVLGSLRQQGRLDYALEAALRGPLASLPAAIRTILRLGLYQVWFLDRVPDAAAVHQAVEAAKRHGHAGTARLVNAVLRRLAAEGEPPPPPPDRDPAGHLAVTQSHPRWLMERWIARWGAEEARALCAANNVPPPSVLRVNLLRTTPEAVADRLRQRGLQVAPGSLPEALRVRGTLALRLDLYREGLVTMQDEGAMAVAHFLAPHPGETVLDGTAGSGIKATHLAELMRNQGRIVAMDIQPAKLKALSGHCARLGIDIVEAHHLDARQAGAHFRGRMDRVLVDAPCTGLGVLGRRPEIRWRIAPQDIPALAAQQRSLLIGVAEAVRPGGTLVYAVCSLEPEEGPEVVERFLRLRPAFILEEARLLLPHRHGTDGFYMARLRRQV
ncbi:MAG: 16S rRNA (cytosine(967)-C(5))-methyltransferase RsmB [Armatimonadota bacterium]|nr:16S rRNA (cytosine(967)-C(5))-methyltransferase RsmB [Armatimonadota bacterium]MDR7427910.1 16S rRNA (cytosine(967)-C(5))-methyltransferase RsmB [Armatimonadota bacterium]MDR7464179.1 16S rRNA (cytosine(967)-C(5))-methyltransferase RsmB [Armatimonadota bacterium]MDR7470598.1 16S rRNA (cytosine(967)-C(5))-methyltransferase RsmB [Armatimonadota bacterium]MDR7538817.1 16S rRNA (cytosine(967)-C(5))-methyltransferase RsmB [Armatimonadota bacterium]